MALLCKFDDAANTRSQELQKSNWQNLCSLLGQEVLFATGAEKPGKDATAAATLQVEFFDSYLRQEGFKCTQYQFVHRPTLMLPFKLYPQQLRRTSQMHSKHPVQ